MCVQRDTVGQVGLKYLAQHASLRSCTYSFVAFILLIYKNVLIGNC